MALKEIVESMDEVPETLKEDYEPHEGGGFRLKLVKGLLVGIDRERQNARETGRVAATLKERLGSMTDKDLSELADLHKIIAGQPDAAAAKAKLKELFPDQAARDRAEIARLNKKLADNAINDMIANAITAANGNPRLLRPWLDSVATVSRTGKVTLKEDPTVSFDTLSDFLVSYGMKQVPGAFAAQYSGNSGGFRHGARGGSNAPAGNGGGPAAPKSRSRMSIQEKAAYVRANGTDKFMELPE